MGWKSCYIIAANRDCPHGYLGTLPRHDPERATTIFKKLGYETTNRRESPIIDYPRDNLVTLGAYDKAVVVSDQSIYDCFDDRNHPLLKKALSIYPDGTLVIVVLHSVVNLFGYALYENGQLVREYGGNGDDGVTHEFGEPLEEERDAFAKSKLINGERFFLSEYDGVTEDVTPDCYGETLVFAVLERYYGEILDQSEHLWPEDLQGEAIDKHNDFAPDELHKRLTKPEPKKSEGPWWQRIFK